MKKKNKIIKTALISVFNKSKIIKFATGLLENKIKIFSTSGTRKKLKKNHIKTHKICEITQYPEIINGQVKTIHPKIFGGILGNKKKYFDIIEKYQMTAIDMIVTNFYSFHDTHENMDIEKTIDIGGPAIVRAAAKNYKNVIVITDILDYEKILNEIYNTQYVSLETRLKLAYKAFHYTMNYDYKIKKYFNKKINDLYNNKINNLFPEKINLQYVKKQDLKYGENPHQKASFYIKKNKKTIPGVISSYKQLNGMLLSYNNISDANIALECVNQFYKPTCVIVKHGSPCGAALSDNIELSYLSAYNSDPISAFGGVISFNCLMDDKIIKTILDKQFVEVIVGPEITESGLKIIKQKKNVKLLICGYHNKKNVTFKELHSVNHGLLIQQNNFINNNQHNWNIVSQKKPNELEKKNAFFLWKIIKFIKSNAIVYGQNFKTISIGSGQTSRIDAVKIANAKYYENNKKLHNNKQPIIMASDAFFPFKDSIDIASLLGVSCIIQPGGSIRDSEVIESADKHNISMIFTGIRNFKH
ncbi:Bifunctional purine biosynthesis protein PurH [Buchnera aphidicola (Phyllaphis fagi)]|uniref:bifunctional phosphoribosylaminoimidazolecarboxamide formyltransferase/IMP cyclohydrolase n=1 Tax=Buchnera aphidicola TaxID=9 RepID=UPI003464C66A